MCRDTQLQSTTGEGSQEGCSQSLLLATRPPSHALSSQSGGSQQLFKEEVAENKHKHAALAWTAQGEGGWQTWPVNQHSCQAGLSDLLPTAALLGLSVLVSLIHLRGGSFFQNTSHPLPAPSLPGFPTPIKLSRLAALKTGEGRKI